MKYSFKELVDVPKLQDLTDAIYAAFSIPCSVIAIDGEILTGVGWQRICTDFHRKHPQTEKECVESDLKIRSKLDRGDPFVIYKCPMGLVAASSPVIIADEGLARLEVLEAADALRESEERYRLLADHATDMISKHAPDGAYTYASPACCTLIGLSPEDLTGRSTYGFIRPADRHPVTVAPVVL